MPFVQQGSYSAAGPLQLQEIPGVEADGWSGHGTISHEGVVYSVSAESVCYHKASGEFLTLEEGRNRSLPLSIFVDENRLVRGISLG